MASKESSESNERGSEEDLAASVQEDPPGAAPKVFMSYSHDTPDHKRWVATLSTDLRATGVDVVLDQWELSLGADVGLFMVRGIQDADRVCVVCTPTYKLKAEGGTGGVGYEGSVINGELVKKADTTKFIPVLREGKPEESIPGWLTSRRHIPFVEASDYAGSLEELARDIHNAPKNPKPPLGTNPYRAEAAAPKSFTVAASYDEEKELSASRGNVGPSGLSATPDAVVSSPEEAYRAARNLIRTNDMLGWQDLTKLVRRTFPARLLEWREEHQGDHLSTKDHVLNMGGGAVEAAMPLFAVAIAATESARAEYRDQRALLDDILHIRSWPRSGLVALVEMPSALVYVYAYLNGATCLMTGQLDLALSLADTPVRREDNEKHAPLWRHHRILGWPQGLSGDCAKAWEYVGSLAGKFPYLSEVFFRDGDYTISLNAFNLLVSALELSHFLGTPKGPSVLDERAHCTIDLPPMFARSGQDTVDAAFEMAFARTPAVELLSQRTGVGPKVIRAYWPKWAERLEGFWKDAHLFMRMLSLPKELP